MVAPLQVLAGLLTVTLLVLNANIAMMSQYQQASDHMQQRRKAQKLYLLLELHNWLVQSSTHTCARRRQGLVSHAQVLYLRQLLSAAALHATICTVCMGRCQMRNAQVAACHLRSTQLCIHLSSPNDLPD